MNRFERTARRVDAFQQRHGPAAFVLGVVKKYGDDNAGALCVQLTYTMFLTVFPLLLLLVTVLAVVLAHDPAGRERVANSAFGQFPIIGTQLSHSIHPRHSSTVFGSVVGLLGLAYGATGLAQSGLYAMAQVWNVPAAVRPTYFARLGRSVEFLVLLAVGVVLSTGLSAFGTFGRHNVMLGYLGELLAVLVNVGLYLLAFRILTPKQVANARLWPGAIFGGVVWTVLQAVGGYVVGHDLKGASATYGMFGLVIGLIAWIYLGAEITLYAAEVNTVLARKLWPRAMVQPPLTAADQESIALQVLENQRRPEQEVITRVHGRAMTEDEYRARGYRLDADAPVRSWTSSEVSAALPASDALAPGTADGREKEGAGER